MMPLRALLGCEEHSRGRTRIVERDVVVIVRTVFGGNCFVTATWSPVAQVRPAVLKTRTGA